MLLYMGEIGVCVCGRGGGRNVEIIGIPKIYELIDINTLYN